MKLNFWQWLGVVLLVVATVLWFMRRQNEQKEAEFGTPAITYPDTGKEPTTEPASEDVMEPTTAPS